MAWRWAAARSQATTLGTAGLVLALAGLPEVLAQEPSAPSRSTVATGPALAVPPAGVIQEIELQDGSVLYGRIESVSDGTVVFRTLGQVALTLQRTDVAAVREARGRVEGSEFVPADPNATRLFFGPTGRALPRGRAYVGIYELLMPFVQVGLTDRLSIGAGTPLLFPLDGGERPFWVTPKFQLIGGDRVQVAAGVFQVLNVDDGYFGIAYGVATFGDADRAVTVGAGWSYWPRDQYDPPGTRTGSAIVMVGAERRVSRRLKLLTENYVFHEGAIVGAGVRFLGERLSADLGLAVPLGEESVVVFPVVNFVWSFGQ